MNKFKNELFGRRVREKRGSKSLRAVAAELDIGLATLSRVENGKMPDLHNFGVLCQWLGDDPTTYFHIDENDTDNPITVQLRAARAISAETAGAFMEIVRAVYAQTLDSASEDEKA